MTVRSVTKDTESRTLTAEAEFTATPDQVWQLWEDPRLLERWWGPPTYPATVLKHELAPGGRIHYYMTSPEGERFHGWWQVREVDAPRSLEFEDGFADESGTPDPNMPVTTTRVTIEGQDDGTTRMTFVTTFPSTEAMDQLAEMGMEEGLRGSLGQIDEILAGKSGIR